MGALPRRAVVLFLDGAACTAVDEIRTRWDPVMCGRIGAHITLVHDVVDHDLAAQAVAAAAATTGPFTVRLTDTAHWGRSAYGVYLHVDDPTGGIGALHRELAHLEEPRWARVAFRAHCTLVHSRTTEPTVAARAWAELDGFHAGWDVELAALDVIEMDDVTGWRTVERWALTSTLVAD
jgi:2'-5' RNA ligase